MSLSLAKSVWSTGERLLYTQLNAITTELLKAIDGTAGGTYSPSAKIVIAGSNGLEIGGTGSAEQLRYTSHSESRIIQLCFGHTVSGEWSRVNIAGIYNHWQHNAAGTGTLIIDVPNLPHGNTLRTVEVSVIGTTGGTLPGTMPTVSMWQITDSATETQIGSTATDASASNAAYTALHTISVTGLSHTIDRTDNAYFIRIQGATGGGATALRVREVKLSVDITSQSEW